MKIFVGSTAYEVDPVTSVEALKLQIENAEFVPSHSICLMHGAEEIEGGSLESNGVEEDDTLEMRMAVNAGMRKKWRKKRSKYMTLAEQIEILGWLGVSFPHLACCCCFFSIY